MNSNPQESLWVKVLWKERKREPGGDCGFRFSAEGREGGRHTGETPYTLSLQASQPNENQDSSGNGAIGISEVSADAGIVGSCWAAPLAKLGSARAKSMSGSAGQAK